MQLLGREYTAPSRREEREREHLSGPGITPQDWGEPVNIPVCPKYRNQTIEQKFDSALGITEATKASNSQRYPYDNPINFMVRAWKTEPDTQLGSDFSTMPQG